MSLPPAPDYAMMESMDDHGGQFSHYRLRRLVVFLLRWWWVPVLTLVIGLGSGAGLALWSPPTFVSIARMWQTEKLRLPDGAMFAEDIQNFLGTQTELLQSELLRQFALTRLRTANTNIVVPKAPDGQPVLVPIRVVGSAKSSVFRLEATSSEAAFTQAYLEALMGVYLEYKKSVRKEVSGVTLASITEQVQRTEAELKEAQDKLTAFQTNKNLAIVLQEATIAGGYLATLKTKLSDLELEERLLKAAALEKRLSGSGTNLAVAWADPVSGTASAGTTEEFKERQSVFKELEMLKIQREKLSRHLRPKHPKIVKLDGDIARGEKLMEIFRRQKREQLEASQQATQLRIDTVQASIREWEGKVEKANASMAEAEILKLKVQRVQSVYDRLMLLVQNVGLSRNIDQENLSILEHASPAERSYRFEIAILALAGVGGLGLGLGIILLIALRDDRFMSLAEVVEKLGDHIVGQVPENPQLHSNRPLLLPASSEQPYIYAEAFRSLRSAILFLAVDGARPKTLLVTSALPGEGKSTIAVNLARTLAMGGSRVVLIDADLRKGVVHELTSLRPEPGLSDLLRHPGDVDKTIQYNSLPNLAHICRGCAVRNPGDMFLTPALDQILARLREQFNYVIIDSSPVFASDDATTLAPKVDGTLFVVRSGFSSASQVSEALALLNQRQARVLGLIVNRANSSARAYNYYKYADYHGGSELSSPLQEPVVGHVQHG